MKWITRWFKPNACPYCGSYKDCKPSCPTRACQRCGGLGIVIDFDNRFGVSKDGEILYGGKLCPRCRET